MAAWASIVPIPIDHRLLPHREEGILPGADGDTNWRDVLHRARKANILEDADVRRFCWRWIRVTACRCQESSWMFSTTVADKLNVFGQPLAAGDHAFSVSTFATKLVGVGVALEGYHGMGDPSANEDIVAAAQGASPTDPSLWFLDPQGLAATPYVYLIPVGVDSMRSPPLGDSSRIRTWECGGPRDPDALQCWWLQFSTKKLYQSADSLLEPLFGIRKHDAFRPVSDIAKFELVFYSDSMPRVEFINNRLVGRSVWNSKWKLDLGSTLSNDPNEGLDRFIRTITDIKINFTTYSYSGN